jgi:chromate transporter
LTDSDGAEPPGPRPIRLSRLARVFAWIGLTSVGGGRYAFFYDALVVRRRWIRTDEFVQDLTLSQVVPGPTFSNIAVALGFRLGGWRGALWGGAALVVPGALILLALAVVYFQGGVIPSSGGVMRGMSAAVVGLVFAATSRVIRAAIVDWRAPLIAAIMFLLIAVLHVNTALAILVVVPVSLWLYRPRRAR